MRHMQSAGGVSRVRRQALLFLSATLVPCAVLVVLGLRLMEQERQLEARRVADARQGLILQTKTPRKSPNRSRLRRAPAVATRG